jgi:hypothetical protein
VIGGGEQHWTLVFVILISLLVTFGSLAGKRVRTVFGL